MKDWFIIFSACLFCSVFLIVYLKYRLTDIINSWSDTLSDIKQELSGVQQELSELKQQKPESAKPEVTEPPINPFDGSSTNGNDAETPTSTSATDEKTSTSTNDDGSQKPPKTDYNLLEDKPWVKLMKNVFFIQDYINKEAAQVDISQQPIDFIEFLNSQFEALYRNNNLTPIQGDKSFDWKRHIPAGSQSPDDNDAIEETITPGWQYADRVFKPAIVSIASKNKENNN